MRIFKIRAFAVDNAVLFLISIAFVPMFLFASSTRRSRSATVLGDAGLYLLIFFAGFATASQFGGRILDQRGARPAVVAGCAIAAVGFFLWAPPAARPQLQQPVVLGGRRRGRHRAGARPGQHRRASTGRRRPATARSPGSPRRCATSAPASGSRCSGTILIEREQVAPRGVAVDSSASRPRRPTQIADALSGSGGGVAVGQRSPSTPARAAQKVFEQVQHDFALSCRTVFYGMAVAMAVAFVVALVAMPAGRVTQVFDTPEDAAADKPGRQAAVTTRRSRGDPDERERDRARRADRLRRRWTRSSSATASTGLEGPPLRAVRAHALASARCTGRRRSPTTPRRTASGR